MSRFGKVAITSVLLSFAVAAVFPARSGAQDEPPRPTIGIALSGGGAFGLAEIGVLRYLEEHRIPIDVIAGTRLVLQQLHRYLARYAKGSSVNNCVNFGGGDYSSNRHETGLSGGGVRPSADRKP